LGVRDVGLVEKLSKASEGGGSLSGACGKREEMGVPWKRECGK